MPPCQRARDQGRWGCSMRPGARGHRRGSGQDSGSPVSHWGNRSGHQLIQAPSFRLLPLQGSRSPGAQRAPAFLVLIVLRGLRPQHLHASLHRAALTWGPGSDFTRHSSHAHGRRGVRPHTPAHLPRAPRFPAKEPGGRACPAPGLT